MVAVKDSAVNLPLSGVTVELTGPGNYDITKTTGQGFFSQTDWSGGSGQQNFAVTNRYAGDDGNVDVSTSTGNVVLKQSFGNYSPTGQLESSTFDTGSASNFYSLFWAPQNQPPLSGATPVKFQVATAGTSSPNGPWNYKGPDGTAGTYYTVSGTQIAGAANDEFLRYMAYFSTDVATVTPSLSDASFTYTSACIPPGEVLFQGLSAGDYTLNVSKAGYSPSNTPITVGSGWQSTEIKLGP